MAEFAFNCPLCAQKIRCGPDWSGHHIQCPSCHGDITVPAAPAQESKPPKAGISLAQQEKAVPPVLPAGAESAHMARAFALGQGFATPPKPSRAKKIAITAACVVLIPPALYFGGKAAMDWQGTFNANRKKQAEESGGGEVGHIAAVYDALDKTDPARNSTLPSGGGKGQARRNRSEAGGDTGTNSVAETNAIIKPTWTLDLEQVQLQKGKVNGTISGSNFVAKAAYVDVNGGSHVLTLRPGTNFNAEAEVLVYLKVKSGESLNGQTWTITSDATANVPQVVKKWRPNPRFAPQQKSFSKGYAMKLEFGTTNQNTIPGKIFLALPDPEQSVIAGQFTANIRVAKPAPLAAAPAQRRPPQQPPNFYQPARVY